MLRDRGLSFAAWRTPTGGSRASTSRTACSTRSDLEATRLDRSMSWVVQKAWKLARSQIVAMPSANDAPVGGVAADDADDPADGPR